MLFFLKRNVRKLLEKDEKIVCTRKVFFYLKTPDGKSYHNPIHLRKGLSTKGGLVSSTGLFLTSRGRIILLGNRTRNNFLTSPYTQTLLDLTKDQMKKVSYEDADINTGGFPSKGIVLKITTEENKEYELGVGGNGFSKIFDLTKIYTFKRQRENIKKPIINFLKDKIISTQ